MGILDSKRPGFRVGAVATVSQSQMKRLLDTPVPDPASAPFAEAPAWHSVAEGWRPIYGNFRDLGFSFEWHDFRSAKPIDWARSFHPGSIELCLNLEGTSEVRDGQGTHTLRRGELAFYHSGRPALAASRAGGERHRFVTVEYSRAFLARQFQEQAPDLHPLVRGVMKDERPESRIVILAQNTLELTQFVDRLRRPPVFAPAQRIWFASKAVELAALFFFQPDGGELFCTRAKRSGRDRVEKARAILRERYQEPPALEELSREVGCSQYYLSRLFSQEAGMTIQQYLRQLRLERAAELLRSGECNVTEAALAVGYNSLSHFSAAFHELHGCCPGLYPLQTPAQRNG